MSLNSLMSRRVPCRFVQYLHKRVAGSGRLCTIWCASTGDFLDSWANLLQSNQSKESGWRLGMIGVIDDRSL